MNTGLQTLATPTKERNVIKSFISRIICAAIIFCGISVNAQVNSYNYTSSAVCAPSSDATAAFNNIAGVSGEVVLYGTGSTTGITAWDNEVYVGSTGVGYPIGFPFTINSVTYNNVYIAANGYVTFGTAPAYTGTWPNTISSDVTPISGAGTYAASIAAYGRDLINNSGTKISVLSTGGVLTIQWIGQRKSGSALAGTMYMQIKLYQTTNKIEIYHRTIAQTGATAFAITNNIFGEIGLRGNTNSDVNNLNWQPSSFPNNWPTTTPVFPNNTLAANNNYKVLTKGNTSTTTSSITCDTKFTWTPNGCSAPSALNIPPITLTYNSVIVNFTEPSTLPTLPYEFEVRTGGAAGSGPIGLTTSGNAAVGSGTTGTITGLAGGTTYTFYIRSECSAGNYSAWQSITFTTKCTPTNIPYAQNFNTSVPPAIPTCNFSEVLTTFVSTLGSERAIWITSNPTAPTWGFTTKHARIRELTGNSAPNNATYFTEGVNLTGGQSYRLQYTYGASSELPSTEQNMMVRYGTAPYESAMLPTTPTVASSDPTAQTAAERTLALANHEAIKGGPFTNVVNFTPATSGVYYIGFTDYTAENNATTLLDDITLGLTTCISPSLYAGSITGVTSGGATIGWTAPGSPPANGYSYYVSSTNTPPINSTTPTGSVAAGVLTATIGGLSSSTTYYVWVRSNCGSGDNSSWTILTNAGAGTNLRDRFTTAAGTSPAACNPSGSGYFQDPLGITNVTVGTINNTTGVEANNYGDYTALGPAYLGETTTATVSITYRTGYTYNTAIWIDLNNDGIFTDVPYPSGERMQIGTSTAAVPTTLVLSFTVPSGFLGQHRMRIGGIDDPIFPGGALTPCRTGAYQAYEDYSVYFTIAPPPLTLSSTSIIECAGVGTNVNITSSLSNYTSYTWSPTLGVTGTAPNYTLNPTSSTIYSLTGFNSSTNATKTVTFNYTVKPAPSAVAATPATGTVCEGAGPAVALSATGGTISGINIYTENFNGTAPGWTSTSNQPLGSWALQPDGYAPFFTDLHSNDLSQFIFTESDAPGSGTTTNTTLTSPAISLVGYTAANLSFWQFYKFYSNINGPENGIVQVGPSATGPWTVLYTNNTGNVGTEAGWVNGSFPIPAALLGANMYVQFKYDATWDWGWGIDNVVITGSGPSTLSWYTTPGVYTGLYTDAAHTNAYTGTAATTVYAWPSATTTYYASAAGAGCNTESNSVVITVTPNNAGTVAPATSTVCSGYLSSSIVSTGSTSGITKWQYTTDPTFLTGITDIAVASSTLTAAQVYTAIGLITTNTYFRAVVSGCGTNYSSWVSVNVSTTTWAGSSWSNGVPSFSKMAIFTGNATLSANLTACSVYVKGTAVVTVNSGYTLQSNSGVYVEDTARLIFQSSASLHQTNASTANLNIGDITYYRNSTAMRAFDYTYWSSPVNLQIPATFSPNTQPDKYYTWNTSLSQWSQWVNTGSSPMPVGKGMIIRAPNSFTSTPAIYNGLFGWNTIDAHGGGVPNMGDYIVNTKKAGTGTNQNKDCLGNPYPGVLNGGLFIQGNATAFGTGTTLYFWTHNTVITTQQYNNGDLASWNYTGGVGTGAPAASSGSGNNTAPNGFIAGGQAFVVNINSAVGAVVPVTFKNSMRATGAGTNFYRTTEANNPNTIPSDLFEKHRIWLELKNAEGAYKQTLVGYVDNATNSYEDGFDGEVYEAGYPLSFYSIVADKKLTIQGRALPFDITDEVPLGLRAPISGMFEINLGDKDGIFLDTNVYLEDKLLNIVHNLSNGSYSFVTEAGTFEDRFVLRYTDTSLSVAQNDFNENAVVVYKDDSSIVVQTSGIVLKSVKVFDVRGREIYVVNDINNTTHEIRGLNAAQEVLLVQITSSNNTVVMKKIIY